MLLTDWNTYRWCIDDIFRHPFFEGGETDTMKKSGILSLHKAIAEVSRPLYKGR